MIGTDGELSTRFDFNYQEVKESCGVTHNNIFFIYGGNQNKRQVLQVIDCGLSLIGTLPFDHSWGACDSSNGLIVLCFDSGDSEYSDDYKQCRKATQPLGEWSDMTPSTYDHHVTQIATSSGNLNVTPFKKNVFLF